MTNVFAKVTQTPVNPEDLGNCPRKEEFCKIFSAFDTDRKNGLTLSSVKCSDFNCCSHLEHLLDKSCFKIVFPHLGQNP